MLRLMKVLFVLAVLATVGFIAYAFAGPIFFPVEFSAPVEEVTKPVTLEVE